MIKMIRKTLGQVQTDLAMKYPNKKLSDEWFFLKNGFYMVWDREDKIITELWSELEPEKFHLLTFETWAFSGSSNYWRPVVGSAEKVRVIRRIWLCGSDVELMCNYVDNGYKPHQNFSCEHKITKDQQIKHIEIIH